MWSSKTLKPQPASPVPGSRPVPAAMPATAAARPAARVLQSSRTPQQLSFEFRRG
ncbi:MAG: hypothetical protein AB1430_16170 [Pseudomonadota bacterium]